MFETYALARGTSGRTFVVSVLVHVVAVMATVTLPLFVIGPEIRPSLRDATEIVFPTRSVESLITPITPPKTAPKRFAINTPVTPVARPARPAVLRAPQPKLTIDRPETPLIVPQQFELAPPAKPRGLEPAVTRSHPREHTPQVRSGMFVTASASAAVSDALDEPAPISSFGTAQRDSLGARWRVASYERSGFGDVSRRETPLGYADVEGRHPDSSTSFGAATVSAAPGSAGKEVRSAGFKQVTAGKTSADPEPEAVSPVESGSVTILSKPRPRYTEEARRLRIEGDVHLRVLFQPDATVSVLQVIEGLGYGLDQNAVRAAREIQFVPAERNGEAVPLVADVLIRFRLAY